MQVHINDKDAGRCLLALVGSKVTPSDRSRLEELGLMQSGALNGAGYVVAYRKLANISTTGSNQRRIDIALIANKEADEWQKAIDADKKK